MEFNGIVRGAMHSPEEVRSSLIPSSPAQAYRNGPTLAAPDACESAAAMPVPAPPCSTAVDGEGMWRSWTRVFSKPESACLDLLDNCFDAALRPGFAGRVSMDSDDSGGAATVRIQNNSRDPVRRLASALTVYRSSKNAELSRGGGDGGGAKDSIGENGVGLKQGCAALSDCSVVMTRSRQRVEVGIIARGLQSPRGVFLPSVSFEAGDCWAVRDALGEWLTGRPAIRRALADALLRRDDDGVADGLAGLAENLWKGRWRRDDHVFLLVICGLKRGADGGASRGGVAAGPAGAFLRDMRALLPENYINLPARASFDFDIDGTRVDFAHWQRRLVELTKFEVSVATDRPFEDLPEEGWDEPGTGGADGDDGAGASKHKLSIYCGFDARRVDDDMRLKKGSSNCVLYVHSCRAGRLIQKEADARHMLGLSSSGVDYAQGLTVIVNDVDGRLPLTPTKDGIAWSERQNGDVHRRNLLSWTGAVAHLFWTHHKSSFGGSRGGKVKELMKNAIRSCARDEDGESADADFAKANLEGSKFTAFDGVVWKRIQATFDGSWKIRKFPGKPFRLIRGPDTLLSITPERVRKAKGGGGSQKRGRAAEVDGVDSTRPKRARARRVEWDERDDNSEGANRGTPWRDGDIIRVSAGVLSFLRREDKEELFELPILEEFPDIREEYLEVVKRPMDFQTIERDRMPHYASVSELRDDLLLTFQNCILYNGEDSDAGKIARMMIGTLDEAFDSTDMKWVTARVLSYLRDLDENDYFNDPVVEQIPEIREDYLEAVDEPMDFRTIEVERAGRYESIDDLRRDLSLVFQNCMDYNGPDSWVGTVAREMMDRVDDAFEEATVGRRGRKRRVNYARIQREIEDAEEDEEEAASPPKASKKKVPYKTLERQLRQSEKKLEELKGRLAERDERIRTLEGERAAAVPRKGGAKARAGRTKVGAKARAGRTKGGAKSKGR